MKRRTLLKAGLAGIAAGAGLLVPRTVLAAWPQTAFASNKVDEIVNLLHGSGGTTDSKAIEIKMDDIAQDGAMVPITISTSLKTDAITLMVRENPYALVCNHQMSDVMEGFLSMRIKMGKTSDVIVVIKSGGRLHSASRNIKVTIGGCGG